MLENVYIANITIMLGDFLDKCFTHSEGVIYTSCLLFPLQVGFREMMLRDSLTLQKQRIIHASCFIFPRLMAI